MRTYVFAAIGGLLGPVIVGALIWLFGPLTPAFFIAFGVIMVIAVVGIVWLWRGERRWRRLAAEKIRSGTCGS